jgi:hypothetical protein
LVIGQILKLTVPTLAGLLDFLSMSEPRGHP